MNITIFDFDKTLTNYDTMTDFFMFCVKKKPIKLVLLPLYLLFKVLAKLKIISIKKEKELSLFILAPKNINEFKEDCMLFSKSIRFNKIKEIFDNEINLGNRVIILSASPELYLKLIFPFVEVLGTTFNVKKNKIVSIDRHPYGKDKLSALYEIGIKEFDTFYYDSKSDEELFPICRNSFLIKNGCIIETNKK
jgi:hypothetical protein